jgi:threonine/homoserine efflux transporter RhtA
VAIGGHFLGSFGLDLLGKLAAACLVGSVTAATPTRSLIRSLEIGWLGRPLSGKCRQNTHIEGLHAAAIAAVGNLVLYLPVYAVIAGASLFKAPLTDIALQAFVQGFLTAVISLLLYGRAVSILGASGGAAFPALCPAMTAVLAIPILGEWPTAIDWIAIILISDGVYVVSGGPLPGRRT